MTTDEVGLGQGLNSRRTGGAAPASGALLIALAIAGCDGPQSTLDPAGYDAGRIAELFWVMCIGSIVIWGAVVGIAVYAAKRNDPPEGAANLLILGGGVLFSIAILTALLFYGLMLMGTLRAFSGAG